MIPTNHVTTHKLPEAYKGTVQAVASIEKGVPYADPALTVLYKETGFAPYGLDVVSNPGIAVGVNTSGYLAPASEAIEVLGIVSLPLLGTADMNMFNQETYHQVTPTVYQANTLFESAWSYKEAGNYAALFAIKPGDALRPIHSDEITKAIVDGTIPTVDGTSPASVGEVTAINKAFYAGMLVKTCSIADGTYEVTAKAYHNEKCAKALQSFDPMMYNNMAYKPHSFEYDVQGKETKGQHRGIWNIIKYSYATAGFKNLTIQYMVSL